LLTGSSRILPAHKRCDPSSTGAAAQKATQVKVSSGQSRRMAAAVAAAPISPLATVARDPPTSP